jgi:hypothetical protein
MKNYCAYTGKEVEGSSDAIWDDGEWISWEYINQFVEHEPNNTEQGNNEIDDYDKFDELEEIFANLIESAQRYKKATGRYLSIWGELGELYVELQYGIARHRPYAQGSDGRIGNDQIEIKTISPEKKNRHSKSQ